MNQKLQNQIGTKKLQAKSYKLKAEAGFTLMEILVATTIFAFVSVALTSLFNYTLKINRRAEALRQASQGMRNFTEFLVKEIRNGQIDYSVINAGGVNKIQAPIGPCYKPPGAINTDNDNSAGTVYGQGVSGTDNRIGVITPEGDRKCIYLGDAAGTVSANSSSGGHLWVKKNNLAAEEVNPQNFTVDYLAFSVRPLKDPYTSTGGLEKIQPMVQIVAKFTVRLTTGESVSIYYQTAVSSDKYDIPNN